MSEKDLCEKCRKVEIERYGQGAYILPHQHCHHEPKWMPKPCQWCEAWRVFQKGCEISLETKDVELLSRFIKAAHYLITLGRPMEKCPVCGEKI